VEDAEHGVRDPRCPSRPGEILELLTRLLSQVQAFRVGGVRVREFLAAGLDGEVTLGVGDLRLAGVAVLGDQVAGETGEVTVGDDLDGSVVPGDRFAGAGKVNAINDLWIFR
jgi:hypothetical protein